MTNSQSFNQEPSNLIEALMMNTFESPKETSSNIKKQSHLKDSDSDNNSVDEFIKNNYQSKEFDDSDYISDDSLKQFLKLVPPQNHETIKSEANPVDQTLYQNAFNNFSMSRTDDETYFESQKSS